MIDHLTFLIYIIFFTISLLGHGFLFLKIVTKDTTLYNFGYLGLIGFFSVTSISILTSFILKHDFLHNSILHLVGLLSFVFFIRKYKDFYIRHLKTLSIIFFILLIGIYVFKNHDDFPYYHLTYALNLSENKFIVGSGLFGHGFRTPSSLFFFHSILYMPKIEYYLFHAGPFFILLFFNLFLIDKLFSNIKNNKTDLTFYLSLLSLIFVNVVFYRIGEHGTDRSSQIILLLIFIIFYELIYSNLKNIDKNNQLNFFFILIILSASIKALYFLYVFLIPFVLLTKRYYSKYLSFKNIRILLFLFVSFSSIISINVLSTGCIIYPESKTCYEKFDWSIPKEEVKRLKDHYEWWSKAGGANGKNTNLKKEDYVKNFNWLENWIDKHYFNKVNDTLLGILFISFIVYLFFKGSKKKRYTRKNYLIYFLLLIFFSEWFLNHPQMRYGGFVLFALPIFFLVSQYLSLFNNKEKKIYFATIFLIILTFSIYNIRNVIRIDKESRVYNFKIFKSPYFDVQKVEIKEVTKNDEFVIYRPKNKNQFCWASKTPCVYRDKLKVKKFLNFEIVKRDLK